MNKKSEIFYEEIDKHTKRLLGFFKWLAIAGVIGIVVGLVGTAFYFGLDFVTDFRSPL